MPLPPIEFSFLKKYKYPGEVIKIYRKRPSTCNLEFNCKSCRKHVIGVSSGYKKFNPETKLSYNTGIIIFLETNRWYWLNKIKENFSLCEHCYLDFESLDQDCIGAYLMMLRLQNAS